MNIKTISNKVLVMDDDVRIHKVSGKMLKHIGYESEFAKNGEDAIKKYKEALYSGSGFEVVIMDLNISVGMGGKKAVKMLLEIDPKAKIIVSSGYSEDPAMCNFREFGFSGALRKPYTLEELSKVMSEM